MLLPDDIEAKTAEYKPFPMPCLFTRGFTVALTVALIVALTAFNPKFLTPE